MKNAPENKSEFLSGLQGKKCILNTTAHTLCIEAEIIAKKWFFMD